MATGEKAQLNCLAYMNQSNLEVLLLILGLSDNILCQAVRVFEKRLVLKPPNIEKSEFHAQLTKKIALNAGKRQKIQITNPIEDPELVQERKMKEVVIQNVARDSVVSNN